VTISCACSGTDRIELRRASGCKRGGEHDQWVAVGLELLKSGVTGGQAVLGPVEIRGEFRRNGRCHRRAREPQVGNQKGCSAAEGFVIQSTPAVSAAVAFFGPFVPWRSDFLQGCGDPGLVENCRCGGPFGSRPGHGTGARTEG
jgi:hypothetical protein